MVKSAFPRLSCAMLAGAMATVPLRAEPVGSVYKVVRSGQIAPMGFHYDVAHDCRSLGAVSMNVIEPPRNGEVFVHPKKGLVSLGSVSPNANCNHRPVMGVEVYYRSTPGFLGSDTYVIERVFPDGNAQKFKIDVSVR